MEEKKSENKKDLLKIENRFMNGRILEGSDGGLDHRAIKINSLFGGGEEEKKPKPFF